MVRVWENTLMSVDKLTGMNTGADLVSETQLDLKAGHITALVKKMSAASRYEVKMPTGVAAIRGSVVDFFAEGIVQVLQGSVMFQYTGPTGAQMNQLIMGDQMFDARTGTLSTLPNTDKTGMSGTATQLQAEATQTPISVSVTATSQYISPH